MAAAWRRPGHERVSSVTLLNYGRSHPPPRSSDASSASSASSRLNGRLAVAAFAITATLLLGFHFLQHAKYGTSHFNHGSSGVQADAYHGASSGVGEGQPVWLDDSADQGDDAHEVYIKAKAIKRKAGKTSDPQSRSASSWPPPDLVISGSLPSLEDLAIDSPLRVAWEAALDTLTKAAEHAFEEYFVTSEHAVPLPEGVPGTGVSTRQEAADMQAYLDCHSSQGRWVYDEFGSHLANVSATLPVHKQSAHFSSCDKTFYKYQDRRSSDDNAWHVRSSLKWRWEPSPGCAELSSKSGGRRNTALSTAVSSPPSRSTLCQYLKYKNILMIGDAPTQYLLHDLLLDFASTRTQTCYGDLYCSMHGICGDTELGRSFAKDARVYEDIPIPPPVESAAVLDDDVPGYNSQAKRSVAGGDPPLGTTLRYRRSDSFFMNSSPSHPRHQPSSIHPKTGVREINMFAVADSRRSDVVIISKPPSALPIAADGLAGNLGRLSSELQSAPLLGQPGAMRILDLVVQMTQQVWIPELLEALRAMKAPPAPMDNLIVYRGGWRMADDCAESPTAKRPGFDWAGVWRYAGDGPPPHPFPPFLTQLFVSEKYANGINADDTLGDLRTIVYNLQTVIQNHIAREVIMPKLGIVFLDMDSATSVWRSGRVGSASVKEPATRHAMGQIHFSARASAAQPVNCLSMCLPSPGLALEEFFVGSLIRLFEWGWGGDSRAADWIGASFVPVRQRHNHADEHDVE